MTTTLIAIDPGATSGWAMFVDSVLVAAAPQRGMPVIPPINPKLFGGRLNPAGGGLTDEAVIEKPMSYPESPVRDNDLITLAIKVGEWKHYLESNQGVRRVTLVFPREWKGTVPKKIHNKRVLASLTEDELKVLPKRPRAKDYDHNMIDAIGLGLWKVGRSRR